MKKTDDLGTYLAYFDEFDPDELLRHKPNPEHVIAGKGLIKIGAGTTLVGGTGIGKSVLAYQIGVCVALGKPILGVIGVPKPRKVLVIQAENDKDDLSEMFRGICKGVGCKGKDLKGKMVIKRLPSLDNDSLEEALRRLVTDHKSELVILDPYYAYMTGDMNSANDVRDWTGLITHITKDLAVGFLVVAHPNKPRPQETRQWTLYDSAYMAGGSAVLSNWARAGMSLVPASREEYGVFRLLFAKNATKSGLDKPFLVLEHSHEKELPYWGVGANQLGTIDEKAARDSVIKDFKDKHTEVSVRYLMKHFGVSKGVVQRALKDGGTSRASGGHVGGSSGAPTKSKKGKGRKR